MKMKPRPKILNLYGGIGGNRKLWGGGLDITAVEIDPNIAAVYAALWREDRVIVADAHEYLLAHYDEYDFIWSSPPCPSHSVTNHFLNAQGIRRYPDMALYQEIILLEHFFAKGGGKYVVESVRGYHTPLIPPQTSGRHYFWANFKIPTVEGVKIGRMAKLKDGNRGDKKNNLDALGFDLSPFSGIDKYKVLRNCVSPEIGLAIFQAAKGIYEAQRAEAGTLFG